MIKSGPDPIRKVLEEVTFEMKSKGLIKYSSLKGWLQEVVVSRCQRPEAEGIVFPDLNGVQRAKVRVCQMQVERSPGPDHARHLRPS